MVTHAVAQDVPRVRQQLPTHRVLALVVRGLESPGAPELGAAPVRGIDLEIDAGTLVLLAPPAQGRTVVLHLSGDLPGGTAVSPAGLGPRSPEGTWRTAVAGGELGEAPLGADLGPASTAVARRLGLGHRLDVRPADLTPAERALARLAAACADAPDLVALDDPLAGLDEAAAMEVLTAVRDLVDTDGRTVLVTCDLGRLPVTARALADRVVDVGPDESARLLASRT